MLDKWSLRQSETHVSYFLWFSQHLCDNIVSLTHLEGETLWHDNASEFLHIPQNEKTGLGNNCGVFPPLHLDLLHYTVKI